MAKLLPLFRSLHKILLDTITLGAFMIYINYRNPYNRDLIVEYIDKYTFNPNSRYPYYEEDDCANFISQVLHAGGMAQLGSKWDSYNSWFCHTNKVTDLKKVSLTWRGAGYFRRHWGNENGIGLNRAKKFYEMTVSDAIQDYSDLSNLLQIGDVIQYGKPENQNIPYHTQVVYRKGYNSNFGINDVFIAQHTKNRKNASLYEYLTKHSNKEFSKLYVYIIV
jgi:hypothetical protein